MEWRRFFNRSRWDEERAQGLENDLEIETEENIARGMPADQARYAARRKLGSSTLIREEIYRMNSIAFFETLWKDLRYASRVLAKSPGFSAVVVLSLALGIGTHTAIFSLIDSALLKMLPVRNPEELVHFRGVEITGFHTLHSKNSATIIMFSQAYSPLPS